MQGPSSPALIDYCDVLLTAGGVASRVAPLVAEGLVSIGGERALDMLARCREGEGGFEKLKEPVETFELLEKIVLEG